MAYLVYIDHSVTWCTSSLRAAQFLAEASICHRKTVRIVSHAESLVGRVWMYDYRELRWIEQAGGAGLHVDSTRSVPRRMTLT
jgi:hypothetical protein